MLTSDVLLVALAVVLRILLTAGIGAVCARYILQIQPPPYGRVLAIAAAAHLLAKMADVLLGMPLEIVALIPGVVLLVLSYFVFKPTALRLLAFWFAGFAVYFVIHVLLVVLFDVGFLFAVWTPGGTYTAAP